MALRVDKTKCVACRKAPRKKRGTLCIECAKPVEQVLIGCCRCCGAMKELTRSANENVGSLCDDCRALCPTCNDCGDPSYDCLCGTNKR